MPKRRSVQRKRTRRRKQGGGEATRTTNNDGTIDILMDPNITLGLCFFPLSGKIDATTMKVGGLPIGTEYTPWTITSIGKNGAQGLQNAKSLVGMHLTAVKGDDEDYILTSNYDCAVKLIKLVKERCNKGIILRLEPSAPAAPPAPALAGPQRCKMPHCGNFAGADGLCNACRKEEKEEIKNYIKTREPGDTLLDLSTHKRKDILQLVTKSIEELDRDEVEVDGEVDQWMYEIYDVHHA